MGVRNLGDTGQISKVQYDQLQADYRRIATELAQLRASNQQQQQQFAQLIAGIRQQLLSSSETREILCNIATKINEISENIESKD